MYLNTNYPKEKFDNRLYSVLVQGNDFTERVVAAADEVRKTNRGSDDHTAATNEAGKKAATFSDFYEELRAKIPWEVERRLEPQHKETIKRFLYCAEG